MKKILVSVSIIAAVAAVVVGATTAFFSDTETSVGNTFTAGAIDLTIDSHATYNGQSWATSTWELKDLNPTSDKFFNFTDVKPGDSGENTISLHVLNNDAWVCAAVSNLANAENGCTEPESDVNSGNDKTCGNPGVGEGELQNNLVFTIWKDDGVSPTSPEGKCDNIHQPNEPILLSGHPVNGVLPVYDSTTGGGPLAGGQTSCLGVAWNLPAATGNEVQTDSMTGDISFNVVQSRNNADFRCIPPKPITRVDRTQTGFGDGGWAGWSCPAGTHAVGGGIDSSDHPVGGNGVAAPSAPAVDGFNYPVYPHYTYSSGAGETGYVVHDFPGDGFGNTISFHVDCQDN